MVEENTIDLEEKRGPWKVILLICVFVFLCLVLSFVCFGQLIIYLHEEFDFADVFCENVANNYPLWMIGNALFDSVDYPVEVYQNGPGLTGLGWVGEAFVTRGAKVIPFLNACARTPEEKAKADFLIKEVRYYENLGKAQQFKNPPEIEDDSWYGDIDKKGQ